MFEYLESRRLMSVTTLGLGRQLYVFGDNDDNGISVEKVGTSLVVKENRLGGHDGYVEIARYADASFDEIRAWGYDGFDTITIADNVTDPAWIHGGRDSDYLKGGGGHNRIFGFNDLPEDHPQHQHPDDDGANDTLVGGPGYNSLYGQRGHDTLVAASTSYDLMEGGDGNDRFYTNGTGSAYCYGRLGNDTFIPGAQRAFFSGHEGLDTVDYSSFGEAVFVDHTDGVLDGSRYGERRHGILEGIDVVRGSAFNDYMIGNNAGNTFRGGGGSDYILGHGGADAIYGEAGNDTAYGGLGNDVIAGGDNNDRLYGEGDNDTVQGNAGDDRIYGGTHNDVLLGQDGNDSIWGDTGNDKLVGGVGSDYLNAQDGVYANDRVFGDNEDGTGGAGFTDTAVIDHTGTIGLFFADEWHDIESLSY